MESLPKMHQSHLLLNHRDSPLPTPFPSLSFRFLPPPPFSSSSFQLSSIRASPSPSPSPSPKDHPFRKPQDALTHLFQTLNPFFSPLVEPTCIAIAATAFFFMHLQLKPVAAAAEIVPPAEAESATAENLGNAENESAIEELLSNNPGDTEVLRSLVEAKVRARKVDEAIRVVDRLIELEPEELEYPLLKARLYAHNGEHELARKGFEDVLKNDPVSVEAYHGILIATSELNEPTKDLLKRVEEAVTFCQEQNRESEVKDLKLLIAQIKVTDGDYSDALKVYEELVMEEPSDFRPYLCQGVVYTMLRKKDEADEQFEKYRRLVPEDHPYKEYFENSSNIFSQGLEKKGIGAKS